MRRAAAVAVLATLAVPATAAAQTPPATPTPVPPAVPTPAPAAPAAIALTTSSTDLPTAGTALTGRSFTVRVVMKPYVADEKVTVRVYRGSKKIAVRALTPKAVNANTAGVATLKVKTAKPGKLKITASHKASAVASTAVAKAMRVQAFRPQASLGAKGPLVRLLQGKLAALHYAVPRNGVFDGGTADAVMAYRKYTSMARTTIASSDVFSGLLKGKGAWKVRHPQDGHHVEAQLGKQVLALIDGKNVVAIYHISSGKPSTPTVQGKFRVYMKTPGTNAKGMVDSNYFIRGYAIHGYAEVPNYNASHGCLRVPIRDAATIYNWLRIGDVVWVEE
jgi:peptidoglycan hydrolase-like protein with peptidoglycan-binding domain